MHSGNADPAHDARPSAAAGPEVNAEQARKTAASATRPQRVHKETTRPWAVRRPDSPSWVEKIDPF